MATKQPWDRQEAESDEQFMWFAAYRDAVPPRQLARVRCSKSGTVTPTLQTLLDWYNAGAWYDRARAWDEHLDSLKQQEREASVMVTAKDQAARDQTLIHEARELVSRELDKMLKTSMSTGSETLRPGELNKLMENVIKLGRLLQGETTENVGNYIELSLEDARKIQEIRKRTEKK